MNSKIALLLGVLFLAVGCGDFERGAPLPAEEADDGVAGPVTDTTTPGGDDGGVPFNEAHEVLVSNCQSCHGESSATSLKLTGDLDTDYPVVESLVDPSAPADSRLLQKGSGSTSHGGGPALAVGSAGYDTVANWIAAGAEK